MCTVGDFLGLVEHKWEKQGILHCEINQVFKVKSDELNTKYNPTSSESHLKFFWCSADELDTKNLQPYPFRILIKNYLRGNRIGSKMIEFICNELSPRILYAETDNDAVDFHKKFGFKITNLGEKYPGVERFLCKYEITQQKGLNQNNKHENLLLHVHFISLIHFHFSKDSCSLVKLLCLDQSNFTNKHTIAI